MLPAAVTGNVQTGIGLAGNIGHVSGDCSEAGLVEGKMRRAAFGHPITDHAATLAYRGGGVELGNCAQHSPPLTFEAPRRGNAHTRSLRLISPRRAITGEGTVASLVEAAPDRAGVIAARTLAGKISGGELGFDLHPRVRRNHVVGQRNAFVDGDALAKERVALHVAHRGEAMDASDAEPMQHVRHQLLKAHVAHAGDAFGALEVAGRPVAALLALARIVDQELGHLAERAAFLAIVDHQADPTRLRHLDGDLDAVREIRPAGADVRPEHVGAVALVVHAAGERRQTVAELRRIAEAVNRGAADRRQKYLEIGVRDQLRIHAAGLLVQAATQVGLVEREALGDAGQVPNRVDRRFHHAYATVARDDVAVGANAARRDGGADLRHVDVRAGDSDGRPHVVTALKVLAEYLTHQVTPRIERHD